MKRTPVIQFTVPTDDMEEPKKMFDDEILIDD
jgi:hypothetical protein